MMPEVLSELSDRKWSFHVRRNDNHRVREFVAVWLLRSEPVDSFLQPTHGIEDV